MRGDFFRKSSAPESSTMSAATGSSSSRTGAANLCAQAGQAVGVEVVSATGNRTKQTGQMAVGVATVSPITGGFAPTPAGIGIYPIGASAATSVGARFPRRPGTARAYRTVYGNFPPG